MIAGAHMYRDLKTGKQITYRRGDIVELTDRQFEKESLDRLEPVEGQAQDGIEYEVAHPESIREGGDTNAVIFDLGGAWMKTEPFESIWGEITSTVPFKITKIEWLKSAKSYLFLAAPDCSLP